MANLSLDEITNNILALKERVAELESVVEMLQERDDRDDGSLDVNMEYSER